MQTLSHYEQLAALFDYPKRDYPAELRRLCGLLEGRYALAAAELEVFARALPGDGESFSADALDEVQEIFTRSFDVQSITTLSVGYVMFGDDYKRGELLVNLNREHYEAGVACGSELPDHLPTVLRLIARWQDRELVTEFVEEILHPALERMIAEFGPQRMEQRNKLYQKHFKTVIASSPQRSTIFLKPLVAVREVLREDFGLSESELPEQGNDFLRSVGRELDIEANEGRPARSGRIL
jgi:nitrate reductase assembly molybdenum cofactor insertion protein NarJ